MRILSLVPFMVVCVLMSCGQGKDGGTGAGETRASLDQAQKDFEEGAKAQNIFLDIYQNGIQALSDGDILHTMTDLVNRSEEGVPEINSQKNLNINSFIASPNPGLSILIPKYPSLRSHIKSYTFSVKYKNAANELVWRAYLNSEALELLDFKDSQLEIRINVKTIQTAIQDLKSQGLTPSEIVLYIDSDEKSAKGDWNASAFQVWINLE